MTRAELIRLLNSRPKKELLDILHTIGDATAQMYPVSLEYAKLYAQREEIDREADIAYGHYRSASKLWIFSMLLAVAMGALTFFVIKEGSFRLVSTILFLLILVFVVVTPFVSRRYDRMVAEADEKLEAMDTQMNGVMEQMMQVAQVYTDALELRRILCPVECNKPEYLQVYIQYFEEGYAHTMRDAKELFDAYLCKKRMGKYADPQELVTQAAQQAAENDAIRKLRAARKAEEAASEEEQPEEVAQEPADSDTED